MKKDPIFTTFKESQKYADWLEFSKIFVAHYKNHFREKEDTIITIINEGWDEENPGIPAPQFERVDDLFVHVNGDLEALMAFCNLVQIRKSLRPPKIDKVKMAQFSSIGWWKVIEDPDDDDGPDPPAAVSRTSPTVSAEEAPAIPSARLKPPEPSAAPAPWYGHRNYNKKDESSSDSSSSSSSSSRPRKHHNDSSDSSGSGSMRCSSTSSSRASRLCQSSGHGKKNHKHCPDGQSKHGQSKHGTHGYHRGYSKHKSKCGDQNSDSSM